MKEIAILFSTDMVRAILNGTKSQTRRVCKPLIGSTGVADVYHRPDGNYIGTHLKVGDGCGITPVFGCPYGQPGDVLWVRETWQQECEYIKFKESDWADGYLNATGGYIYKADGVELPDSVAFGKWKPSIFMPREACRIKLLIKSIRVERLQDISEEDAQAEGYASDGDESARIWYSMLWDKINGHGSWEANPFVWVIEFEKL